MESLNIKNEDCLIGLKKLKDDSVDLVFCDLPYGITDCKDWDQKLDLKKLSKELWRVSKKYCTLVFTCKFKFGMELSQGTPKRNLFDKSQGWLPSIIFQ